MNQFHKERAFRFSRAYAWLENWNLKREYDLQFSFLAKICQRWCRIRWSGDDDERRRFQLSEFILHFAETFFLCFRLQPWPFLCFFFFSIPFGQRPFSVISFLSLSLPSVFLPFLAISSSSSLAFFLPVAPLIFLFPQLCRKPHSIPLFLLIFLCFFF